MHQNAVEITDASLEYLGENMVILTDPVDGNTTRIDIVPISIRRCRRRIDIDPM